MASLIYLIHGNDQLVEMVERPYDTEDLLQRLLASYPSLLTGDQVNAASPRRWLLVAREMGLASQEGSGDRWSVDHLFIDQDGVPTIVEVKRSTDTRIRREVVGQMLDYAANAVVYWPVETIHSQFDTYWTVQGADPAQIFAEMLGEDVDEERFWLNVKTNLQAGRVRLVFVADAIPSELRRIIEYLGAQMDPTEVIGIEIKQYVGDNVKALVPRAINTAPRRDTQAATELGRWDEHTFLHALGALKGGQAIQTAEEILHWADKRSLRLWWGKGKQSGSFYPMVGPEGPQQQWTIAVWTTGQVSFQFGSMATRPPFHNESLLLELVERVNQIPGVAITPDKVTKYPSVQIGTFADPAVLRQLLDVLDWIVDTTRKALEPAL